MNSLPIRGRIWLFLFLLCSLVFGYPDANDSTAFLYGSRADRSVFRLDLKSTGFIKEILPARAGYTSAIGLLRGNYDQFSLLYSDTAIHRSKLSPFNALPKDEYLLQASDSAVFVGTDPHLNFSANFYYFQSTATHHAIYRVDVNPLNSYEVAYLDLPGYTADLIDGAIDEGNGWGYGLLANQSTNSIQFLRWTLSGGTYVDVLPAGSQYRKLIQFVLDETKDTAIFFDDAASRFVKLCISAGTWGDSSSFTTDTVLDFSLSKNGDLVWSNGLNIYRSGFKNPSATVLKSEANVKSIVLDEGNVKPFIDSVLSKPLNVVSGTSIRIPNQYNQIWDYDYDKITCKIEGTLLKTKQFFSGCSLYIDATNAAAGSQDQIRFIVGDAHGGTDTANITVNVTPNSGISVSLPSSASVAAYGEQRWKVPVSHSIQTKMLDVKIRKLSTGVSYIPSPGDTDCVTQKEDWLAQVITPTVSGEISDITLSGGYNGPVIFRIYYGIGVSASLQYEQFVPSMGTGLLKKIPISDYAYISSGATYTIAVVPLQDSMATYCLDTLNPSGGLGILRAANPTNPGFSMQIQMRIGEYQSEFVNLSRNPDTLSLGFVGGVEWIGIARNYRIEANDFNSRTVREMTVMVSSGSAGPFVAGPDVRIPAWTGFMSSSSAMADVYDWSTEVSTDPRTYNYEFLDSSLALLQYIYLDPQGGLKVNVAESKFGSQKFRMQRCYSPNNSPCSNWDTVKVTVSRPPAIVLPKVDSLVAGLNTTIRLRTPDPDSGDHALHKLSVTPVVMAANQSVATSSSSRLSALQTFQATKSGPLNLIQVNAAFTATRLPVTFYKVYSTSWTNIFDTTEAKPLFQKLMIVPTSTTVSAINLAVPEVFLDSGSHYGILLGEAAAASSPHPFLIGLNQTSGSFTGTSYTVTSGTLVPNASEDIQFKVFVRSSFSGASNVALLPIDTMAWNVTPNSSDVGLNKLFAFTVSDGTAESSDILSTRIAAAPIPPITLTLTIPQSVRVNGNPYDRQKFFFPQWASGSFGVSPFRETQYLTSKDSAILDGRPWLEQDGSLSFSLRANTFGTSNFRMRLCDSAGKSCSLWDTSSVLVTRAPEFNPSLPSSIVSGSDTTVRMIVKDQDAGDLAKLSIRVNTLKAGDQQTKNTRTFRANAVGQFFRVSSQGTLGEIQVYAKFPDSYVQYMIGDSALLGDSTSHGKESMLEGYANVIPDTLMWHSIPILGDSLLRANVTYQFSVGYGGSLPRAVDWGIDTTGAYLKGSMLEWLDEDTTSLDTLSRQGGKHIIYPRYDLMFQLYWRSSGPSWITATSSVNSTSIDGYRELRLKPTAADTGFWKLLISVSDGISGAGNVQGLRVNPATVNPPVLNPSIASIGAQTQGQAVLLKANGTDTLTFSKRFTLTVRLKGSSLDSSLIMRNTTTVIAPIPEGKYQLSWALTDSVKTYSSGKDSFNISIPIHTPPRLQTWYMIGFGSKSLSLDSLKPANYVYRWDDMRTNGIELGAYTPRNELLEANPGEGFWYFAEVADSIQTPAIAKMPSSLQIPVVRGGTGWNMISNPWNWAIQLDTLHDYFAWNDSIGGYRPIDILYPLMAAWVNVTDETALSLSPQPVFAGSSGLLAKRTLARFVSPEQWTVQVSLTSGKLTDSWNFFGISGRTQPEPPAGLGEQVSLAFVSNSQLLASDMRSSNEDASWTMQLGTDRSRSAELHFEGIQALYSAGLRAVLILKDGVVREVPASGSVNVNLSRGTQLAKLQVVTAKEDLRMNGGIRGMKVVSLPEHSLVQFDIPLSLVGKSGLIERTSANGRILERKTLSSVHAGTNYITLKTSAEPGFIRIRISGETSSISATK